MTNQTRQFYLVTRRRKDIFEIAEEVYGSRLMAGVILHANPGVHRLCAGMALALPDGVPQQPISAAQALCLDFAGLGKTGYNPA